MFRSRRSTLLKRLWKCRVLQQGNHEGDSASEGVLADDKEIKALTNSLLKRLKESQLEVLAHAVESKGGDSTSALTCVKLPNSPLKLGKRTVQPHVLFTQIWRWNDIHLDSDKLKQFPVCNSDNNTSVICCNPYHWSRMVVPENLPPLYEKAFAERLYNKTEENSAPSVVESQETIGNTSPLKYTGDSGVSTGSDGGGIVWCNVAYWELRERVGRLLPVTSPHLNVFQDLPHGGGDGMCLSVTQPPNAATHLQRTREKIGFGITLSREGDDGGGGGGGGASAVWLYNRSQHPAFVHSPTLELPNTRTSQVTRVPAGHCIKLYDYALSDVFESLREPRPCDGPIDPRAVQISFVKGWGSAYSRQFVTSCDCWLEVLFNR